MTDLEHELRELEPYEHLVRRLRRAGLKITDEAADAIERLRKELAKR